MSSIALIVTFVLGLLAAPVLADAQEPGKVYRIGMLRAVCRSQSYR